MLVVSIGLARGLKNHFNNNLALPNTGAQRATSLLHDRFPALAGDSDQIVFSTRRGSLAAPRTRAQVTATLKAVARQPHVVRVESPYDTRGAISRDGTIGFATIAFDERGDALPQAAVKQVVKVAEAGRTSNVDVALGGYAIEESQRPTVGAATEIGIVAAMVVLFLTFGSFLAMTLPIVVALFGIGTSMGVIALLTHVLTTPDFASELALLIGLGVGVDYALFVVTRFREAYRDGEHDVDAAVEIAMNTAGRSVAFAGATVVIAVLGLFVVGVNLLYGVAVATSLTVLLMLAASLTLLPALLSFSGHRIAKKGRSRREQGAGWSRWVAMIQRRPAVAALLATAFMVALAIPAIDLRLASSDASNDRASTTTHRAYTLLAKGFGVGFNGPLQVAVEFGDKSGEGLSQLEQALAHAPGVASVRPPVVNRARNAAAITVFPTTAPQSKQTYELVKRLRSKVIPPIAQARGLSVFVGGATATQVDFAHVLSKNLALFIAVVIALSAFLLLAVFRSLLIPLQAAVMNVLAIAAALGVVQAVFERGWAAGLLGVTQSPVEAFIPIIVFAIVFGLSMDYEVFLVSRIHEEWVHGADASTAIRRGVSRTGRVVTAAAGVMIVVFGSFAGSDNHLLKLFGLSLATAVFLDAVVIRSILLPAVFELFGRAAWRFPAWADRLLPRLAIEPATEDRLTFDGPTPLPTEVG
jgi:RND superfamily putative drug exporter